MGAKRGKMLKRVTTSFHLASDWLRKWHEFCQPIAKRSSTRRKQSQDLFPVLSSLKKHSTRVQRMVGFSERI